MIETSKQEKLIAQLFKDVLAIFLLSMFTAAIGGIIDGIITGKFLGSEAMAAFGFTVPYQNFMSIFPFVTALGMIRTLTEDYLQAYSLGLPAIAAVAIFTPIMQLDNDRRRAVIATAVLSVCNITGDLINIFVLDGGLWGMGIVTAASYYIAAGILLTHPKE